MRMPTVRTTLLVAAAFACASLAGAAVAKPAASAAAKPAPARSTQHTATGTIESYDAAGKTLTVKGTASTSMFSVSEAKVWSGSKSVGLDDLSSHSGAHVTVKYSEKDGKKEASTVRVAAPRHSASKSR